VSSTELMLKKGRGLGKYWSVSLTTHTAVGPL